MKTSNFTLDEAIILSSLHISFIDGDMDSSELKLIIQDDFLKNHFSSEIGDLFFDLIKDPSISLVDLIQTEFKISFKKSTKEYLKLFMHSLFRLVVVDGKVEKDEVLLLNLIGISAGFTIDEVSLLIEEIAK